MRDLDEMLNELSEKESDPDQTKLSQIEKKRIYQMTMNKIGEEKATRKKQRLKAGVTKAATVAMIVAGIGITGTKVGAMMGLDNSIKQFFGIKNNEEQCAQTMVTTSNAKSSDQGVTLNISQTIGDTSRFYVVFTANFISDFRLSA